MEAKEFRNQYQNIQMRLAIETEAFPWESRECYISWLTQTYEYAERSTRILALTAGHMDLSKTSLSNRFIKHAAEETGHERLLMNDLSALNVDRRNQKILASAEAFHKSLYFWIYNNRPLVILGWVLSLEGLAVQNGPLIYDRVKTAHGAKAASFLKVHAHEDIDHLEKAFKLIESLTSTDLEDVGHGLKLYAELYIQIYRDIKLNFYHSKMDEHYQNQKKAS